MKTIRLLQVAMLLVIVTFTSCNKNELSGLSSGKEVTVTLATQLPTPTVRTRAGAEVPDIAGYHIRYILEVWTTGSNPELFNRQVISAENKVGNFNLKFVSGQTYDILLWADYTKDGENTEGVDLNADLHYLTPSLKKVKKNTDANYSGFFDIDAYGTRDAFYAHKQIEVKEDISESITLKRAVSQVNIYLTDYEDVPVSFQPDNTAITIEAPTMMDLSSGLVSPEKVYYSAKTSVDATTPAKVKAFTGYYFAPMDKSELINFTISLKKGVDEITTYDVTNIPIQRNYRTNISGNMLTKSGSISVDINSDYMEPDYETEVVTINTAAEIQAKLNNGAKSIIVTEPLTADLTILIPSIYATSDQDISITIPSTSKYNVTVEQNTNLASGQAPKNLFLNLEKAEKLVINTPGISVIVDEGTYSTIETTTSTAELESVRAHKFILGRNATVGTLTAKLGDILLFGIIETALTREESFTQSKGEVARGIENKDDAVRAGTDNISGYDYLFIGGYISMPSTPQVRTVDLGGIVYTQPMVVNRNTDIQNFTINNSTIKPAFKIASSNVNVKLSNATINQSAGGRAVEINDKHSNIKFTIQNSNIIIPTKLQYGIMVINASDVLVTIDGTHIAPQKDRMANELTDYTEEQINAFKTRTDSRSVAVANSKNVRVDIRNSVLEGSAYAVYTQNSDFITINVDKSTLDGRAALEIANTYKDAIMDNKSVYNITNSKLVGRNYFGGPTENFATIVFYDTDDRISENNYVYVKDSEIYCFNNPQTLTNWQYAVDMRPNKRNLLSLSGVKMMDHSKRLDYFVEIQSDLNEFNATDVTIQGKDGVTILPKTIE